MPYEYGNAGAALRESASGPETTNGGGAPSEQDNQEQPPKSDTFYLPDDYPGAADLQPGDTLQLKVVGRDKDGQVEVECVHDDVEKGGTPADGKKPLMQDMDESLTE